MKHTHHLPLFHSPPRLASSIFFFHYLVSCPFSWEKERERRAPFLSLSLSFSREERGYNPLTHQAQSKIQAAQAAHSTVDVPSITHRHEWGRKEKKENGREETQERRKEARGRGGGEHLRDTPAGEVPTRKIDAPGNLPVVLCSLYYTRPSAKSLKRLPIWAESRNFNRQHQPLALCSFPPPSRFLSSQSLLKHEPVALWESSRCNLVIAARHSLFVPQSFLALYLTLTAIFHRHWISSSY